LFLFRANLSRALNFRLPPCEEGTGQHQQGRTMNEHTFRSAPSVEQASLGSLEAVLN
jgi:hypothetical protein